MDFKTYQKPPSLRLFTLVLRGGDLVGLLSLDALDLARERGGELGEGALIVGHTDSEGLEVLELVGQTDGATVDEHPVPGLAGHLVNLEDTLTEHGGLSLHEEVLAETHGVAHADTIADSGVLVHEAVDLGHAVADLDGMDVEHGGELVSTSTDALLLGGHDGREGGNRVEEVTHGREVLALALDDVGPHEALGGHGVGLEREVVVGDGLVVALDGLEELVSGSLDTLGDLDEESLLGLGEVDTSTVGDLAGLSLTDLDGADNALVEVLAHGLGLGTEERAASLAEVALDTGQHLEATLELLLVGGHSVGEGVKAGLEGSLGGLEVGSRTGRVAGDGSSVLLVGHDSRELQAPELHGVASRSLGKIAGGGERVVGGLLADLGELGSEETVEGDNLLVSSALVHVEGSTELATGTHGPGVALVGELGDALELGLGAAVHTELASLVGDNLTRHNLDLASEAGLLVLPM